MSKTLEYSTIPTLKTRLRGEVIFKDDELYNEARRVWNGRIDKYPFMIVRCLDVTDVLTALEIAHDWNMTVAVRSGGHSMVGYSVSDGGIVIDLSHMKNIWVDPIKRVAQVQAGLTLENLFANHRLTVWQPPLAPSQELALVDSHWVEGLVG